MEVKKDELARELGVSRRSVNLASSEEILSLGFTLGGVSPFGFEHHNAVYFIDNAFDDCNEEYIYMGCGDSFHTLKLRLNDFRDLTQTYRRIGGKNSSC